jgi:peptidoglycan-associated lipoprotein
MSVVKSGCLFLLLAVAAAACHTRPPALSPSHTVSTAAAVPARPPAPPPPSVREGARPAAAPPTEDELFRRKSLDELNAEHPLGDVFFDYDQAMLREDARPALRQNAQWLARWPQTVIRIDGHCDERGTAEYNLALGDRRADAVREYLTNLGVKPDRIQIRSLGKEAPFCREAGESCYAQNRRGHFVIAAK